MNRSPMALLRSALLCTLIAGLCPVAFAAQEGDDENSRRELEGLELLHILRTAPAPPLPPETIYSDAESRSPEHRSLVGHDPATGETGTAQPGAAGEAGESLHHPQQLPQLLWDEDQGRFVEPAAPLSPWASPEGSGDEEVAGSCTPPSPNLFTHDYPWSTVYKLLMRFNSGGVDYYYVCSAASMGSFHLITAGHCIYNHDPNGDGSTADADWADEVWAWAAQTDLVNPFYGQPGDADWPYSFAKSVYMRTYNGWINSADFNHDMGYVTLDRRDGDHTGWMGREANVAASSLNFNGYPSETPYVIPGERRQHPGYDPGNVTSTTTYRINMCAYTYGGHSGGPVWRYLDPNRWIQGVNSTSNRSGSASATRIDTGKFNDITNVMAMDETDRPPLSRPDLAENVFTTVDDLKDLLTNSVAQGGSFQVEYNVLNAGFAASGTVTVNFYLSTNNVISTGDTFIGSRTLSSIAPWTFTNPTTTLTANVAPGTYYLGWIVSGTVAEYGGDLLCNGVPCTNVAVIADETLTVTGSTCTPDAWEPDDTPGQASGLIPSAQQTHSICPVGDEDWGTFTLGAAAHGWQVSLATSGGGPDDTRLWLYDAGLNQVEFDDDDGPGLYSYIERSCGFEALPPGTYYVRVDEFGDDDEIDSYGLLLTQVPCPAGLFSDGFESGTASAWDVFVP